MKGTLAVVGGIMGTIAGIGIIFAVLYFGGIVGNNVKASYNRHVVTSKIRQNINTPLFAQGQYERFFNLCAAIQADEASLDEQYLLLRSAEGDDASRIRANIGGLVATRADSITQYNADSTEWTRGAFRDANLPYRIPLSPFKEGDTLTSCVAS